MYYLYVIQSVPTGRHYIGSTRNVPIRLAQHNAGKTPSTKPYRPWQIVLTETYATLTEARQRERQVKSWKNPGYMINTLKPDSKG